jgi:hypothetical protein
MAAWEGAREVNGIAARNCERHARRKIAKVNASGWDDIQQVNRRHACRRK